VPDSGQFLLTSVFPLFDLGDKLRVMTDTHHRLFLCEEAWRYERAEKGLTSVFCMYK